VLASADSGSTYRRFDMTTRRFSKAVGTPGKFLPTFEASSGNLVVTGWPAEGNLAVQRIEARQPDGTRPLELGQSESNSYTPAAARDRPDGASEVAVAYRPDPGVCLSDMPVEIYTVRGTRVSRRRADLDSVNAGPAVPGISGGVEVHDLWWTDRGRLRATVGSWTCRTSGDGQARIVAPTRPAAPWELRGRVWQPVPGKPATFVRQIQDGREVALVTPDCYDEKSRPSQSPVFCTTGTLSLRSAGRSSLVARGVVTAAVPPRK
jgi:hypothetical protein